MSSDEISERISIDLKFHHGQPVIDGTRVPIAVILDLLASGSSWDSILASYPSLTRADIRATLHYAAKLVREQEAINVEVLATYDR